MALDWLIIGGGIHGMHIAARLLGESGVAPERLRSRFAPKAGLSRVWARRLREAYTRVYSVFDLSKYEQPSTPKSKTSPPSLACRTGARRW